MSEQAQRRVPRGVWLIVLLVALGIASMCSIAIGARFIPFDSAWDLLVSGAAHNPEASTNPDTAVIAARIPRTVAGIVVGAALGLAGTGLQGVTRNPLADPGIMGLNAGAAAAIIAAVLFFGVTTSSGYVWFAFVGATLALVVGYLVASIGREGATPVKLALAGAAITAGLNSLIQGALVLNRDALEIFRSWQTGAIGVKDWEPIMQLLPFMVVGLVLSLGTSRLLNALAMGDDMAIALGQNVVLGRIISGLGIVLLSASATAMVGPIVFVGLVIPHLVRALVGTDYRWIMPYSILAAPLVILLADTLGRVIMPPGEVPAGVIAVFIGAPVFIFLIRSRKAVSL